MSDKYSAIMPKTGRTSVNIETEETGFDWNRLNTALRFLSAVKPWWSAYSQRAKFVPISVQSDEGRPYGAITAIDRDMVVYIDTSFVRKAPIEEIAGAVEREFRLHTHSVWSRLRDLDEEEWEKWANICFDMEVSSAIREEARLLMEVPEAVEGLNIVGLRAFLNAHGFTVSKDDDNPEIPSSFDLRLSAMKGVFSREEADELGITGPPIPPEGWEPTDYGMPPGKSAEEYLEIIRSSEDEEDDDDDDSADDEGDDENEEEDQSPEEDQEQEQDQSPDDEDESEEDDDDGDSEDEEADDDPDESEADEDQEGSSGEQSDEEDDDEESSGGEEDEEAESENGGESEDESDDLGDSGGEEADNDEAEEGSESGQNDEEEESDAESDPDAENDAEGGSEGDSDESDEESDENEDDSEADGDESDENADDDGGSDSSDEKSDQDGGSDGDDSDDGEPREGSIAEQIDSDRHADELKGWIAQSVENEDDPLGHQYWKPERDDEEFEETSIQERDDALDDFQDKFDTFSKTAEFSSSDADSINVSAERKRNRRTDWATRFNQMVLNKTSQVETGGLSDISLLKRNPNQAMIGPILPGMIEHKCVVYGLLDVSFSMRGIYANAVNVFADISEQVFMDSGIEPTWFMGDEKIISVGDFSDWNHIKANAFNKEMFKGGTNFIQIMEDICEGRVVFDGKQYPAPDILVVLTDMQMDFPKQRVASGRTEFIFASVLPYVDKEKNERYGMGVNELRTANRFIPKWLDLNSEFVYVGEPL